MKKMSIPLSLFEGNAGGKPDIVLIRNGYRPPGIVLPPVELPTVVTLLDMVKL